MTLSSVAPRFFFLNSLFELTPLALLISGSRICDSYSNFPAFLLQVQILSSVLLSVCYVRGE